MIDGFIILKREITENEWYSEPAVMHLYIHCLMKANFTDRRWRGIEIKRGQFVTSQNNLSAETGLSPKQVRNALDKLKQSELIASQSTNKFTVITVLDYDETQRGGTEECREEVSGQPEGKQRATTNKDNKDNNDNNDNKLCERVADEFNELCRELPKIPRLDKRRRKAIKKAAEILNGDFGSLFKKVNSSDFLCGRTGSWQAGFDWILKPENLNKILEGNYDNRTSGSEAERQASYDIKKLEEFDALDFIV